MVVEVGGGWGGVCGWPEDAGHVPLYFPAARRHSLEAHCPHPPPISHCPTLRTHARSAEKRAAFVRFIREEAGLDQPTLLRVRVRVWCGVGWTSGAVCSSAFKLTSFIACPSPTSEFHPHCTTPHRHHCIAHHHHCLPPLQVMHHVPDTMGRSLERLRANLEVMQRPEHAGLTLEQIRRCGALGQAAVGGGRAGNGVRMGCGWVPRA